jgi:tetratricopeptide (TPR) repeat protein
MRITATFQLGGTTPVSETLRWLNEQEARGVRQAILRANRAGALAMLGRFDEARSLLAELRKEAAERGAKLQLAVAMFIGADVELWAMGNPVAALELGEEGCRMLEQFGEKAWQSSAAGNVAQASYQLGRLEEADAWAGRVRELAASDDAVTQMQWRWVRAKVLARRGAHDEAERLAREAVAIAERTDGLNWQGHALCDLAEVLAAAGRIDEAAVALEQALEHYERKENLAMVAQVRPRLEELRAGVS